jgi:hypothetical protein
MVASSPDPITARYYLAKAIEMELAAESCPDAHLRTGFLKVAQGWRTLAGGQVDRDLRLSAETQPHDTRELLKKSSG